MTDTIQMIHGSGGSATGELIRAVFAKEFDNDVLNAMEDAAVVAGTAKIALTTDSFVVDPLFFRGGDIGRLSVCGTVNDLLCRNSVPKYLTAGFIIEEGLATADLQRIVRSMADTAKEAGVRVVAGDTKVVEGKGGLIINTAGVGLFADGAQISGIDHIAPGDAILLSGTIGEHHGAILSERLSIENTLQSDCAPLHKMVEALRAAKLPVHAMRDVTRGGLATVLSELSEAAGKTFSLSEEAIPVLPEVRSFAGLLGLDPLYMGNEGKLVVILPADAAEEALSLLRLAPYGKSAARIGTVTEETSGEAVLCTPIGGRRRLTVLRGEGLPRIC